jgi:hypothetical protein
LCISCGTRNDSRNFKGLGEDFRHIPVSVRGDWAQLTAFGAPVSGPENSVPGGRIADAQRGRSRALGDPVWCCASASCFHHQRGFDMCAADA